MKDNVSTGHMIQHKIITRSHNSNMKIIHKRQHYLLLASFSAELSSCNVFLTAEHNINRALF